MIFKANLIQKIFIILKNNVIFEQRKSLFTIDYI